MTAKQLYSNSFFSTTINTGGVCVEWQGEIEWGMKRLVEDVGFKEAWVKGGSSSPAVVWTCWKNGGREVSEKDISSRSRG